MRNGRIVLTALFILIFAGGAGTAAAQSPQPASRWTFGGTAGFGQTWDDEGSIGTGLLAGGYVDWRLVGRTDLELSVDLLRHTRSGGHFEAEGHTTFLSASIAQRFGGRNANGYVLGGVTLGSHSGSAGFPADNLVTDTSGTHHGFLFGGGMAFRAGRRLEIGPVVRIAVLSIDNDSGPASAIMAGVRIGFGG